MVQMLIISLREFVSLSSSYLREVHLEEWASSCPESWLSIDTRAQHAPSLLVCSLWELGLLKYDQRCCVLCPLSGHLWSLGLKDSFRGCAAVVSPPLSPMSLILALTTPCIASLDIKVTMHTSCSGVYQGKYVLKCFAHSAMNKRGHPFKGLLSLCGNSIVIHTMY